MIVIDAHNITHGGGKVLLDYLEDTLGSNDTEYFVFSKQYLESEVFDGFQNLLSKFSFFKRRLVLNKLVDQYKPNTLLSFGNYPPPIKLKGVRVCTYLQNALLLPDSDLSVFAFSTRFKFVLKRKYLKLKLKNTDFLIVQTPIMKNRFLNCFDFPNDKCFVFPFYDLSIINEVLNKPQVDSKENSFIYVSSPTPHKNHNVLFTAWEMLLKNGYTPKLYITLADRAESLHLIDHVNSINIAGGNITNLGYMGYEDLLNKVRSCSFVIYPSLEETLGLGLIEGQLLGCNILVANRDYWKDTISPSGVFKAKSPKSIYHCVIRALKEKLPRTSLHLDNKAQDFINFLSKKT